MRPPALLAAVLLLVGASSKKDTLVHVVEAGDTLWSISAKPDVYDDPYLWPVIYKFNRDQIQDPARIYPQQHLLIPIHVEEPARSEARSQAGAPAPDR
ncbi:MAG: LysM peptidoglycan-binding domain-containing protein [Myxococcota bacterium]